MSVTKTQQKIFNELETFTKEKLGEDFFDGADILTQKVDQYSLELFRMNGATRIRLLQMVSYEYLGKPEARFGNIYKTIITTLLNKEGAEEMKQLIKTICQ